MSLSMIAAVARNGVIGRANDLPWSLPDDLAFFRETTRGHAIILGRKNYASIGRLLPCRKNIILTRDTSFHIDGATIVHSMEEALHEAANDDEPFIIGGADMYKMFFGQATRLYLTEVDADVEGDIHFPTFDRTKWREVSRTHHEADDRHAYAFDIVVFERV